MSTLTENKPAESCRARVAYATPPCNLSETKEGFVLEAEMPGVAKDGIEITIENGELAIVGRRKAVEVKGEPFHRESRAYDYRRAFDLDPSIDTARITAKMEQGVLTVVLPKTEAVKPQKITVN